MLNRHKVILICHYFPPHNNCGVRRVLYWANSLANKGHDVTVLTTRKTEEQLRPEGVDQKIKIVDYSYGRLRVLENGAIDSFGFSAQSYGVWWQKFAVKIKRSLINPFLGQIADPNLPSVMLTILSFWLKYKLGSKSSQIDFTDATIISTAPPWSMHLFGAALAHLFNCPLIIDYRDQFSNSHMFGGYLSSLEYKIDGFLCRRAQKVITVSPSMNTYYSNFNDNTRLLMNGYDPNLFWPDTFDMNRSSPFTIRYFGSIQHATRLPIVLLEALKKTSANVTLDFYGDVPLIEDYLLENPELNKNVKVNAGVPQAQVRKLMAESDYNLLCETISGTSLSHTGVMTSKLFEYLAVERPILALISPKSDMVSVLSDSDLLVGPFQNKSEVLSWLNSLNDNRLEFEPKRSHIQKFSREKSVNLLLNLLEEKL